MSPTNSGVHLPQIAVSWTPPSSEENTSSSQPFLFFETYPELTVNIANQPASGQGKIGTILAKCYANLYDSYCGPGPPPVNHFVTCERIVAWISKHLVVLLHKR